MAMRLFVIVCILILLLPLTAFSETNKITNEHLLGSWHVAAHSIQPYLSPERKNKSLDYIDRIVFYKNGSVGFSETIKGHTTKIESKYEVSQDEILIRDGDNSVIFSFAFEVVDEGQGLNLESRYHKIELRKY